MAAEHVAAVAPLGRVDAPDADARDGTGERRRHEGVVERAERTVERVGVLVVGRRRHQVGQAGRGQHLHRVLLAVRVEVAEQDDVVALVVVGRDLADPLHEAVRLGDALRVEEALAVGRLGAAARPAGSST